jgi:hypothetical protein
VAQPLPRVPRLYLRRENTVNSLAGFLLLTIPLVSVAQAPPITGGATVHNNATTVLRITFHVTSVHYEDNFSDCDPAECSAKTYTIEGYADSAHTGRRTVYVLTCEEFWHTNQLHTSLYLVVAFMQISTMMQRCLAIQLTFGPKRNTPLRHTVVLIASCPRSK